MEESDEELYMMDIGIGRRDEAIMRSERKQWSSSVRADKSSWVVDHLSWQVEGEVEVVR